MGSRYGGLKQIDPVGPSGEIVIDYSIYDAIACGYGKLVFVIRRDIENMFREAIGSKFEDKVQVEYVFQELDLLPDGFALPPERQKPWGTAHAVMAARDAISEPFAVINADDFYGRAGFQLMHDHFQGLGEAGPTEYSVVGFTLSNTLSDHGSVARGVCRSDDDTFLSSITEMTKIEPTPDGAVNTGEDGTKTPLTGREWVSMNMWGFTPEFFDQAHQAFVKFLETRIREPKAEFFIPLVVDDLIVSGTARVRILPSPDKWFGVTYPEDKPTVVASIQKLVDQGLYPASLWG
jgi:NDP-sugar pyrophosphorylase family protein